MRANTKRWSRDEREAVGGWDTESVLEYVGAPAAHGRHPSRLVGAVIREAGDIRRVRGPATAKAFASAFLDRSPSHTTTPAGRAAIHLETWLAKNAPGLWEKFLETEVGDKGGDFYATFVGALTKEEVVEVVSGAGTFAKMEPVVRTGQTSGDHAYTSDVTVFRGTPIGDGRGRRGGGRVPVVQRAGVGAPTTERAYRDLALEGGLHGDVFRWAFNADAVPSVDQNGVEWNPIGERMVPDPSTFEGTDELTTGSVVGQIGADFLGMDPLPTGPGRQRGVAYAGGADRDRLSRSSMSEKESRIVGAVREIVRADPDYGQVFYREADDSVLVVLSDGAVDEGGKRVRAALGGVVKSVKVADEYFPPKKAGWVMLYPAHRLWESPAAESAAAAAYADAIGDAGLRGYARAYLGSLDESGGPGPNPDDFGVGEFAASCVRIDVAAMTEGGGPGSVGYGADGTGDIGGDGGDRMVGDVSADPIVGDDGVDPDIPAAPNFRTTEMGGVERLLGATCAGCAFYAERGDDATRDRCALYEIDVYPESVCDSFDPIDDGEGSEYGLDADAAPGGDLLGPGGEPDPATAEGKHTRITTAHNVAPVAGRKRQGGKPTGRGKRVPLSVVKPRGPRARVSESVSRGRLMKTVKRARAFPSRDGDATVYRDVAGDEVGRIDGAGKCFVSA